MKVLVLGSDRTGDAWPIAAASASRARRRPVVGALAVSGDGRRWALINAPLNLGLHLRRHQRLLDDDCRRIILTDAQLDHVGGLLALRHGRPIDLYATPAAFDDVSHGLPLVPVLDNYCGVRWHMVPVAGDHTAVPFHVNGMPGLAFTAWAASGPAPRYTARWTGESMVGDAVTVQVENLSDGQRLLFAPALPALSHAMLDSLQPGDRLLVGTGCSDHPAACPHDEPALMAREVARLRDHHRQLGRITVQVDSAPVLDSAGQRILDDAGIELAYDGMEIDV